MDAQKEALQRIITTLANKNEELQNFLETVDLTLTGLQAESCRVMSDLEAEIEQLRSTLEEKGAELCTAIKEEQQRKEAELQSQLMEGKMALSSCLELLEFSNQTLKITNEEEFLQIDVSGCFLRDNGATVAWRPCCASTANADDRAHCYTLEFCKTDRNITARAAGEMSWERIDDIQETEFTITGLKFDSLYVVIRVRARNKAAAGDFSEPVALETKAFNFSFDEATAHPELKVQGDTVTWEPQGVKGHNPRLKGKENKSSRSSTPSPNKRAGSQSGRERFAGDSYTVLGDQGMSGGCHYWELRPLADWKSLSVGVAYRSSLGRFDQLGKSTGSWCLHATQWLQSSLAAKHSNRAKPLDWPLPQRIGIYCDCDNGDLLFIDVDRLHLLHSFKIKFTQPLVPAFSVWCGGITIATGLQVPSFMGNFLSTNRSLSNLSQ
ncbi:FSD1-like protein isoform X2 [Genypterus blacodes]|uniref:FSD1-like protein isoform X2 n=1 Tax=Genypterus blacodes TaxID=154954 RepID=UPI003F76B1C7